LREAQLESLNIVVALGMASLGAVNATSRGDWWRCFADPAVQQKLATPVDWRAGRNRRAGIDDPGFGVHFSRGGW